MFTDLSHMGRLRKVQTSLLFLHVRCGNVYENKGPLWKRWGGSGNVYENKGSYPFKAGIYVKTGRLMFSAEINQNPRSDK